MPQEPGCIAPAAQRRPGDRAARRHLPRADLGRPAQPDRRASTTTSPPRASTTARPIRWAASGPAPSTSRGTHARPSCIRVDLREPGGKPADRAQGRTTRPPPTGWPGRPSADRVLGRHAQPRHPRLGLGCRRPTLMSSHHVFHQFPAKPAAGSRASRATAAGPDGAAVDARATTGARCSKASGCCKLSPAGECCRSRAAGALPDHALLRRRRPAARCMSPARSTTGRRGAAGAAAVGLRDRDARRRAGPARQFLQRLSRKNINRREPTARPLTIAAWTSPLPRWSSASAPPPRGHAAAHPRRRQQGFLRRAAAGRAAGHRPLARHHQLRAERAGGDRARRHAAGRAGSRAGRARPVPAVRAAALRPRGATVGGMVAAGLSGPARASVGSVRDYVLGLTWSTAAASC